MDSIIAPEGTKELVLEISKDFYRYADNNLWIKNKDSEIVKFVPTPAQKALIDRTLWLLANGKPVRIIVLKARQMGLSTAIEALIYWYTTTHKNVTAMIVGHEDTSSKNLYNMFKRYYEHCNPIFQPTRKYNTKNDLVFDVDDAIKEKNKNLGLPSPGLGSVIKTGTAKNVSAGRSDTVQLLHASEIGEWENGEELVASLLQTVPLRPNTMIFLESTAKGMGNYFHKEWENAAKGDSIFEPFFFAWWMHDEYEQPGDIDHYTDEEKAILKLFEEAGVPEDKWEAKINFRRYKEKEFRTDRRKLYQEYPSTDYEAFLASGRPRFDIESLVHYRTEAEATVDKFYDLVENDQKEVSAVGVHDSPLKIWDLPQRGVEYVIGADVAEGLKNGDYSVADIIDSKTLKTVARWRGHIDPDRFGNILDQLGRFYNYALIGCEINNHGLTTVQRLRDLFYTNLYRRERGMDERFEEATARLGWKTDIRTKPLMIDYLAEAIRDRLVEDYDVVFVREAMTYVIDDSGRTNAEEGTFDDTVIAKAIGLQMFEWSQNNKGDLSAFKPQKMTARKKAHRVLK
jgi:hypothetical protein